MPIEANQILRILDCCCDEFSFPMLDNGYFYLAATRLSLYRTVSDWSMVIETFGFSPRVGSPDTSIYTFGSTLYNRKAPERYVKREACDLYLANHPNDEFRSVYPIESGDWQDGECDEIVAEDAAEFVVRGQSRPLPPVDQYPQRGITLEDPPRVHVFELCRFLADTERESVLANANERRISVPPDMPQILQLEEWHHPNVVDNNDRPSGSETFQQLAQVLATGDLVFYRPSRPPNTHWRNWPEGGAL